MSRTINLDIPKSAAERANHHLTHCSHGYSYQVLCHQCEAIWHLEQLQHAERAVARHKAALDRLAKGDL